MTTHFQELVSAFGAQCKERLAGPGEREALIRAPFNNLMTGIGVAWGMKVIPHDEVREQDGAVRPDYAISVDGVVAGHVELKAPGVSLDPASYGASTANYRQWQRLKELPNLLHSNGLEWRLWRNGEMVHPPVFLGGNSIATAGSLLTAGKGFDTLVRDFLEWEPLPITSVGRLVERVAPLARAIREEVREALRSERRAIKAGADRSEQPFLGAADSWRRLLFPGATDEEFGNGYAQTVTFALLLARAEGSDLHNKSLHDISKELDASHALMGKALDLLTEHADGPVARTVQLLGRVVAAVEWDQISKGSTDVYLHLYEHFLAHYDNEMRKKTGSFYTPAGVVNQMTRLTEDALVQFFGKQRAFRDPSVTVLDGSMGTGTYPLTILERAGLQAKAEYGEAAEPEALTSLAARMYGIEIQSGPFSVAELRITKTLRDKHADLPAGGLNLYVADTLESPFSASNDQLSYTEQLIAKQRKLANQMKRDKNIRVVISNPPYKERSRGLGGWVETGDSGHPGWAPLDDFRHPGNGVHEGMALNNLYVFFWRWAMWKVFESTPSSEQLFDGDSGIVCYITAKGYVTGLGFKGMRKYIREKCSQGWIIDLTPEGQQPPAANAIFNIETPVAVAIFIREPGTSEYEPAVIKHISLDGTRDEKISKMAGLTFDDARWQTARSGWTAPFTPAAEGGWDDYPAMDDLMPWYTTGLSANRTWVYGPTPEILEARFRELVYETDPEKKKKLLKATRDSTLTKVKKALPSRTVDNLPDTEQSTGVKLDDVLLVDKIKAIRIAYRSFDRQYILADSRVLDMPRPPLWAARMPGQVFTTESHSIHPGKGPGLTHAALMPDMNHFRGSRGGRVFPLFHPDGTPNVANGLLDALSERFGKPVSANDLLAYTACVMSHPGYVDAFQEELTTPGNRLPITGDATLWEKAVRVGEEVLWLHSYGECYRSDAENRGDNVRDRAGFAHPKYIKQVKDLPEVKTYSAVDGTLHIGSGEFGPVSPAVANYTVGGSKILDLWYGYRKKDPNGRITSPLDEINQQSWDPNWTVELLELLSVLTQLVALEPKQNEILEEIMAGELLTLSTLTSAGVSWPTTDSDRDPKFPLDSSSVLFDDPL